MEKRVRENRRREEGRKERRKDGRRKSITLFEDLVGDIEILSL